jgi:hypothetical protein
MAYNNKEALQMRLSLPLFFFIATSAQAALIDRGEGFIYDDVLDITWTQNASINGADTWENQLAWADGYSQTHSVYGTFDDWRLPTTLQPDPSCSNENIAGSYGYNCTGSEMGHLYNVDGAQLGLFTSLYNLNGLYWSSSFPELYPDLASDFQFINSSGEGVGYQGLNSKGRLSYALGVMDGDIAAVPVPAAVWLFGSALAGLGWMRRKQTV